jgi:8-hydroxy-5-deazaflavin:NADPH oxidoreductase
MTTAVIGTGGLGSAIARQLGAGGETLRLSSPDKDSAQKLAAAIGPNATVAVDNNDALMGSESVILALRFPVVKSVIEEIADAVTNKVVVVPSNPVGVDAQGKVYRLLPDGQSSGEVVSGWLPAKSHLVMTFGTMTAENFTTHANRSPDPAVLFYVSNDDVSSSEAERLIRIAGFEPLRLGDVDQSTRLELNGDLHDVIVGLAEAQSLLDDHGRNHVQQ